MSGATLLTIAFIFVVLCITVYNMHNNQLKHKNNISQEDTSEKDNKKNEE